MASHEFASRFKNKSFIIGKSGFIPVSSGSAVEKTIPLSKLHKSSISPLRYSCENSILYKPGLPRSFPAPSGINISARSNKKFTMSRSPIPNCYSQRSKSPIRNLAEIPISLPKLPRYSQGISKSKILEKIPKLNL